MFKNIRRDAYKPFLKLLDDLYRTNQIEHSRENAAFAEGVDLVISNFEKTLKGCNITTIESIGQAFDHDIHEAVLMREDKTSDKNTILEEFEKGYFFDGEVLKHAKVVVAK